MNIYNLMPDINKLIPYDYNHIKTDEYEQVIKHRLSGLTKQKQPTFIQVGGIPGAGKTTFCQQLVGNLFLSFDAIMENLPGYQQDLFLRGHKEAFKTWEIPARIIGYEILRRAIDARYNVVLEHSGVNTSHLQLFQSLKKLGYHTAMYFILCNLSLAYERAKEREKQTQRFTPQEMINKRYSFVNQYIEQYKKLADNTYLYDSSSNRFILKNKYCA